ncbi:MAG: ribose 5-phosphate isomerase B [Pseudomonadota bacterium]
MKVAIASDHGGVDLKAQIQAEYKGVDVDWIDLGAHTNESVDYPDYGYKLGEFVASGQADFGIAICGSGIGISMALNRNPDIRAAVCTNSTMARLTRIDNNANVLCLGARTTGVLVAMDCLHTFLTTEFEAGGRHERRVNKLNKTMERV